MATTKVRFKIGAIASALMILSEWQHANKTQIRDAAAAQYSAIYTRIVIHENHHIAHFLTLMQSLKIVECTEFTIEACNCSISPDKIVDEIKREVEEYITKIIQDYNATKTSTAHNNDQKAINDLINKATEKVLK